MTHNDELEDDDDEPEDGIAWEERNGFSTFFRAQWSTFFGPGWGGPEFGFKRGMFGKSGQLMRIGALLVQGHGTRETARLVGCSKNTVIKLKRVLFELTGRTFLCECGKSVEHSGWCAPRIAKSPKRQQYLAQFKSPTQAQPE